MKHVNNDVVAESLHHIICDRQSLYKKIKEKSVKFVYFELRRLASSAFSNKQPVSQYLRLFLTATSFPGSLIFPPSQSARGETLGTRLSMTE